MTRVICPECKGSTLVELYGEVPVQFGTCPECNGEGTVPEKEPAHVTAARPAFPALYCAIWPDLVPIAKSLGYALMIHGSMSRDLDLLACPWTEDAVPAAALVEALLHKLQAWVGQTMTGQASISDKPHGRRAWSIMLGGHAVLDISIMPRLPGTQ